MAAIHDILQQCVHTLQFLSLVLGSDLSDPFGFKIPSLTSHLSLEYLEINGVKIGYLSTFASHLPQLISSSVVYFHLGLDGKPSSIFCEESISSWKNVDDTLSDPRFKQLDRFVVSVYPPLPTNTKEFSDHGDLRAILRAAMPKSYKRGILWWKKTIDGKISRISQGDSSELDIAKIKDFYFL
ncbi:hypothetical protein NLI96_g735 [Meripilus lineatus]|uniref:Uncharacterized protein n=1 Tax=Meripilus lineatus TaxID=2056292 RepID=A0AAD5YLQ2_9APHY|nr:hypothetical protein NLI96_g735 [Physisporinus lineatus]